MNFMDVLKKRRAVRSYTSAAIEKEEVETLIEAAVQAPSAMNLQPWAFAVVLDRQQIDGYAKRAQEWLAANLSELPSRQAQQRFHERMRDPDFALFYHAPALVLVMAKSGMTQDMEDACLAAENLMLAARDRDLGTCWIGFALPWLNLRETKVELGLPERYQVVAAIVLGQPIAWPESPGRKPAEIHWITPAPVEAHPPRLEVAR